MKSREFLIKKVHSHQPIDSESLSFTIDEFEISRKGVKITGKASLAGQSAVDIDAVGFPKQAVISIQLEDQLPTFEINLPYAMPFHGLIFRFEFPDQSVVTAQLAIPYQLLQTSQYMKDVGHRKFSWAKPMRRRANHLYAKGLIGNLRKHNPGPALTSYRAQKRTGEVVLPIYNGLEFLESLLPSLGEDQAISRIIIIDDKSSDDSVVALIDQFAKQYTQKVSLIRNETNLGFVQSANAGMALTTDDFVLLNSDVVVPENWIERLLEPIRQDPKIVSTTPFSNAATILSFPIPCEDNDCFSDVSVNTIDQQFQKLRCPNGLPEIPTAIGFCMGISQQAYLQIGGFDQVFGRGYGEENDWCQRARKLNFRHVALPTLYVQHDHGGSFLSEEKQQLIEKHLGILDSRHPNYQAEVHNFIERDPLSPFRNIALIECVAAIEQQGGYVVIFDHNQGGGANTFRKMQIQEYLEIGKSVLLIQPNQNSFRSRVLYKEIDLEIVIQTSNELWGILAGLSISKIEINSLVFFENPVEFMAEFGVYLAKNQTIPSTYFLHDYHSICPSHNLLDSSGHFCKLPDYETCRQCLPNNPYLDEKVFDTREEWNQAWSKLLSQTDQIRTFSDASAHWFRKAYPDLKEKLIVKSHNKTCNSLRPIETDETDRQTTVAIVGNISPAKGAHIVHQLSKTSENLSLVVFGDISEKHKLGPKVIIHGRYEVADLPKLMERKHINIALIPSIWPETYNFVTDELICLEIPIACFDIGAHADRIGDYDKGCVLPLELADQTDHLARRIIEHKQQTTTKKG